MNLVCGPLGDHSPWAFGLNQGQGAECPLFRTIYAKIPRRQKECYPLKQMAGVLTAQCDKATSPAERKGSLSVGSFCDAPCYMYRYHLTLETKETGNACGKWAQETSIKTLILWML